MKLEFKFINKEHIEVIATHNKETKKVGDIFTPSGSSNDNLNSIQVCGIDEAFDLWGCARYSTYKTKNGEYEYEKAKTYGLAPSIIDVFEPDIRNKIIKAIKRDNMKEFDRVRDKKVVMQLKDIQLKFPYPSESIETDRNSGERLFNKCLGCFNEPCTCERKGTHENPYATKRESNVSLEKVKEKSSKKT